MNRLKKTIRKKKSINFIAALVGVGIAITSWATDWEELNPGLSFASQSISPDQVPIYLLDVDPARYRFDILQARDQDKMRLSLRQLIEDKQPAAAINASFFDEQGRPMGLVIVDGKEISPLRQTSWGIFQVISGKPSIIHTRDYQADPHRTLAIQTGPRLVIRGRIPSFKDSSIAPRSAVCLTPQHHVILAATPGLLTLQQWATRLQSSCPDALNLDGGSSTQFYVKAKDLYLPGVEPIPNALAVIAK